MVQENCVKNKIIVICGATATGKTSLAVKVAKMLNSEVISADSMNVYKGLDIGTAKPTQIEMQGVKHHLIDVVSPKESFSVGDYRELAMPIINRLHSQNKIPVVCGGTGFYINSLLFEISYGKICENTAVREKYKALALEFGNEYVYNVLLEKDPLSAKKLHFNDVKRVIRALEIYESGVKKSDIQDSFSPLFDYKAYAINFDRKILYNRIDTRVDSMIQSGLIKEVSSLKDDGITLENQCMQGIGYKEIYAYLNGECSLDDAINQLKLNSRHYAKRQITFFKKLNGLIWLKSKDIDNLAKEIIDNL